MPQTGSLTFPSTFSLDAAWRAFADRERRPLQSNKALKQLPFNGKKTKPAKIRRDYWEPMAMIQFPRGQGVVGVSAFQKLREFRRLHELSYPEEMLALPKAERGKALNDQKANSVADMAAVLAGRGRGNLMAREVAEDGGADRPSRVEATVYWADERDRHFAREWSENVTHETGLPLKAERDGSAGTTDVVEGEGSQPQTSEVIAA